MQLLYPGVIFAIVTQDLTSIGRKNIFLNKSFLIKIVFLFMAFLHGIYYIELLQ